MTTLRHTDPTIYAVAAVLYEDVSLTFADIGQRLGGLTYNEATGILQNLRNAGALTFERRAAPHHIKRDPVGGEMARLIGQSKEQAAFLRVLRRHGWTFEYTGGGHVRCIGPNGQTEIISSRPGEAAKAQFRVHGVTWPEDAQRHRDAPAPEPDGELAAADAAWAAEEQERVEAQIAAAADVPEPEPAPLTLELLARSVDTLAEMIEVLASETRDMRQWAEQEFRDIRDRRLAVDDIEDRVYAVEQSIQTLTKRISTVDPIGSLRRALRGVND